MVDNDLYKFTMMQGARELFPERQAGYRFINRGKEKFTPTMVERLQASINAMAELKLTPEEKEYMTAMGLFKPEFLEWLESFRYQPEQVKLTLTPEGQLDMTISGYWHEAILWEVPLMALVSQIYLDETAPLQCGEKSIFQARTLEKAQKVQHSGLELAEFGTRRRRNFEAQDDVVRIMKESAGETFMGTSNVHLAMKYGTRAIGTVAHEWIMAHAAVFGVERANPKALESWRKIYPNKLKIFLPDTYTSALAFHTLKDADFAERDGFRWDSGDAREFTEALLTRYAMAGVDATQKTIIYSDSLTVDEAVNLRDFADGRIRAVAAIGTHLTNDFNTPALKIVIKMDTFDGMPVVKISDTPSKASGDRAAIAQALKTIEQTKGTTYEMA